MAGIRARRVDADRHDRDITPTSADRTDARSQRLIWVDVDLVAGGAHEPDLLSAIADEVINGYHAVIARVDERIGELDQRALTGRGDVDVLAELVSIRREISEIRRARPAPDRANDVMKALTVLSAVLLPSSSPGS